MNKSNPQVKLEELPVYDFEQVAAATDDFHLSKMLGKGGFGPVYKVYSFVKVIYFIFYVIFIIAANLLVFISSRERCQMVKKLQ